jgi:hypothetical protein
MYAKVYDVQLHYPYTPASVMEIAILSFLLTLVNILCIYLAAIAMLKIKQVTRIEGSDPLWKRVMFSRNQENGQQQQQHGTSSPLSLDKIPYSPTDVEGGQRPETESTAGAYPPQRPVRLPPLSPTELDTIAFRTRLGHLVRLPILPPTSTETYYQSMPLQQQHQTIKSQYSLRHRRRLHSLFSVPSLSQSIGSSAQK